MRKSYDSVCSGALILAKLGLLKGMKATTHPRAKNELEAMDIEVVELPFVYQGNVATAGGCLSAQYLVGWVINKMYGEEKKRKALMEIFPVGQKDIYENLLNASIGSANLQSENAESNERAL